MLRKRKARNDRQVVYCIHAVLGETKKKPFVIKKKVILQVAWIGGFTKHIALANRRNTQGIFAFTKKSESYSDCRDMTKRFERLPEKRNGEKEQVLVFLNDAF